jgi:cytochrome P450
MAAPTFEFMPFGGEAVRDPYPVYSRMREAGRVLTTPFGATIVHRYDDVRQVHVDHESFSMSAMGGSMGMGGEGGGSGLLSAPTMLTTDPPDHERLRKVVSRAFTPRSIAELEPRLRAMCRDLLAPLAAGEPFDLVAEFAAPLPTMVIAELLGIPAEDSLTFRRWTEVVTGTDVRRRTDPARAEEFRRELGDYLAAQLDLRIDDPTDDLIGRMVEANRGEVMTRAEVVAAVVLLLVAGNETTMRLITNMALALSRHPDQLELLGERPDVIPTAVEETLRYDSPVQMLFRGVRKVAAVGDVELQPGQMVLTMLAAANRDPEAFSDPDTYDVQRQGKPHVSFGHGIHFCLGAPLARLEAAIAFEELLAMVPRFEVVTPDDELDYPQMLFLRSPRTLVVRPTS